MAIGDQFRTPITPFLDARTGRELWKVTCWDDAHCISTYMYYQAMSPDDRRLVFASDRTGIFEIYVVDLQQGVTTQLTQRPVLSDLPEDPARNNRKRLARSNWHAPSGEIFFADVEGVSAVNPDTLAQRPVAGLRADSGLRQFHPIPQLTSDGKHLLAWYEDADGKHGLALASTDGRNEQTLLTTIDEGLAGGHLSISRDGNVIAFNIVPDRQNKPDVPHNLRARCWGYHRQHKQVFNLLTMPVGWRATHETWGPDNRLYFHRKHVPDWTPASLDSVAVDGNDHRTHFTSQHRKLGHSAVSPDGRWMVSDVQDATGNELYLVNMARGEAEILCWPDSSLIDGFTGHVHPSFSSTGRRIYFTSDRSGKAAVFVVPLEG